MAGDPHGMTSTAGRRADRSLSGRFTATTRWMMTLVTGANRAAGERKAGVPLHRADPARDARGAGRTPAQSTDTAVTALWSPETTWTYTQ